MRSKQAFITIFLLDVIALFCAFIISYVLAALVSGNILHNTYFDPFSETFVSRIYSFTIMAAALLFSFYNRGHYIRRIPWWNQVRFILIAITMAMFVDGFLHFAIKYQFSRLWISFSWIISFAFILLGRFVSRLICEKINAWKIPTIVIGSGDSALDTLYAIHSDSYTGYDIKTMVLHKTYEGFERDKLPPRYRNINILDGGTDYSDYIASHQGSFYIIAPDSFSDVDVEALVGKLTELHSAYAIVPPVKGISLYGNAPQYFFGHDIMFLQPRPSISSPFGRLVKRMVDVICSTLLLILLAPVFLLLIILVGREGGNVFFAHKRVGYKDKPFYCLKFRTMAVDAEKRLKDLLARDASARAEWEKDFKLKDDPRITTIGKILRKTSLDELPQLFNVLKGEMSLVGPRPIVEDEKKYYGTAMEYYTSVKPGVTGLWQVSGRNDTSYAYRVHLDNWYVKNWSIWYDIVILFKTVMVLVDRKGAY